jgi:hypothetical protein
MERVLAVEAGSDRWSCGWRCKPGPVVVVGLP